MTLRDYNHLSRTRADQLALQECQQEGHGVEFLCDGERYVCYKSGAVFVISKGEHDDA